MTHPRRLTEKYFEDIRKIRNDDLVVCDLLSHIAALEEDIERLKQNPCIYVVTSKEGTSYCRLAEGHL